MLVSVIAFGTMAATCGTTAAAPSRTATSASSRAPSDGVGGSGVDPATQRVLDVPGMDFSELTPAAQKELANVLSDEFCYCGCPHTVGQCLKTHQPCRHAKRMARLAAGYSKDGLASSETIVELQKYYGAFREPRKQIKVDQRMCRGPENAKVTFAEFADFECPYCAAAREPIEEFAKAHPDVRVCYSPFPLAGHPNSQQTGIAALYARDHGKFWQMHRALFENQMVLSPDMIREIAGNLGMSNAELGKAFNDKKYIDELNSWREAGHQAGVDHTPMIFVNGRNFPLVPRVDLLTHTLEDELEWIGNHNGWAAD